MKRLLVFTLLAIALLTVSLWLLRQDRDRVAQVGPSGDLPSLADDLRVSNDSGLQTRTLHPTETVLTPPERASFVDDPDAAFGMLQGAVLSSASRAGVGNAELTFVHDGVAISIYSDAHGRFKFKAHKVGRYELAAAVADGYLPYAPAWGHSPVSFAARKGERIDDVVLYLTPEVDYTGVVLDPKGQPVSGAEVLLLETPGQEQILYQVDTRFIANAKGEFNFHAPDGSVFEARHPGFLPGRAELDLSAQIAHRLTLQLIPEKENVEHPSLSISGLVLLPDGTPASGALVDTQTPPDAVHWIASAVTRADGTFTLSNLNSKKYDVVATLRNHSPARKENVSAGTKGVVLHLSAGEALEGNVTAAADGSPIPAFTVWIGERIGPLKLAYRTSKVVYDSDGYYRVQGLAPGQYLAIVSAQGFAPEKRADIQIKEQQSRPARADFELSFGGRLTGRVLQEGTGAPVADAKIRVEGFRDESPSAVPHIASTTTNDGGHFELRNLARGGCSITVAASEHHARIVSGIAIEEGLDAGPIVVELRRLKEGEQLKLELAGIGAVLEPNGEALAVKQVIEGGGALEVGLGAGDMIQAVDGHPVVELGFDGAIQKIRGPEGTTVVLLIQKASGEEPIEISVPRRKIKV